MPEDIIAKITRIKADIETAQRSKAQAEGRLSALMEQLEKDHGCKTLDAAKKLLTKLETKEQELDQ